MPVGYWCPVLHAHLPYVRHPEYPQFLEEDWLFEATIETYVPLIRVLDGLERDGVRFRLTMTLSPPLLSMLADRLLVERYHRYVDRLGRLCEKEVAARPARTRASRTWRASTSTEFSDIRRAFREVHGSNLVGAFRRHLESGQLEVITCAATHGFLPLLPSDAAAPG